MNLECAITAKTQRCRKWAREWVPVDLGFMNGLMSILMAFFLLGFQRRYGIQPFDLSLTSAFFICYSIFTANVMVQLVNLASHRSARVRIFSNLLLIILFVLLHSYYLITHIPLNCALIIDNFTLGFYKESWYTILGAFPRWLFIILGTGIIILLAIHMKKKILSSPAEYRHPAKKAITAALLYALILLLPVKTYDELTGLLRGIIRYPFHDPMINITIAGYPYLRTFTVTPGLGRPSSAPDIILVMVESYNANVVKKKTPEGKEITPVFNSLIPRGVYVERFYGNSVQTCNGQAAVFLSVIPSIRGKIFTSFPNLSFSALPGILRDAGYETMFVQAARELDFDNTRSFMKKAGFQHIHSAYEFLTDADAPQVWGWGPEDGLFYRLSLRLMDLIRRQCGGRPVFAVLATTSNHMWFDHVPKEKCRIYPDPGDIGQRYANSIHLSDEGLAVLLNGIAARPWLADAAVIITGDHSFPVNEHGISHNEVGFYEELFRIPLVILWNNLLAPRTLAGPFSQIDIAPTILDIAGVSGIKTHFLGQSMLSPGITARPAYLVQPYNGLYLGVVDYPYKYIHHSETGREYLFNLRDDPREEKNLAGRGNPGVMERLRSRLRDIYVNQNVLTLNKLWPSFQ
jgi:arylsulfatase A-like enzyme